MQAITWLGQRGILEEPVTVSPKKVDDGPSAA